MSKRSVILVEDHPLYREGIKSILNNSLRYKAVGEAALLADALSLLEKEKPDFALIDITLGDESGIEVVRRIACDYPDTLPVVVSMHTGIDYLREALKNGARGYIVKESAGDQLLAGLDAIAQGNYYIDSSLSNCIVELLLNSPARRGEELHDAEYDALTSREQEILRGLAEGLSSKEIAERLFISAKTVENHRTNIMHKLQVHSSVELIRYAARIGIIDFEQWTATRGEPRDGS